MIETMRAVADANVFGVGTRAMYDTFSGLVPCKVLEIVKPAYGFMAATERCIRVQLTGTRGAYKKGEVLLVQGAMVPPKRMVRKTQFSHRIITTYSYK